MRRILVLGLLVVFLTSVMALAGDAPKVHKYVWLSHSIVKEASFDTLAKQFRQAAETSNSNMYWLASSNLTGDTRQVTFVTFHDTYASVDEAIAGFNNIGRSIAAKNVNYDRDSMDAEQASHAELLQYEEGLAYRPDMVDVANATRLRVISIQCKPGTSSQFEDFVKEIRDLHQKAGDNAHWIAYRVVSGMPSPSFVIVTPLKSLADLDEDDSAAAKAVFTSTVNRSLDETRRNIVIRAETNLVVVRPDLSRPAPSIVAANPTFWTVKETDQTQTATKEKKGRKSVIEPAAKAEKK